MKEKLSIIIPVYNEAKTLLQLFTKLKSVRFPVETEIIIVDDGSSDGSYEIMKSISRANKNVIISKNPKNMGKGATVANGFRLASGTIMTVQDADLEYDPEDLRKMLEIMLSKGYDVIYGKRPFKFTMKKGYKRNIIGNYGLSLFASIAYGQRIRDIETCYKMVRSEVIKTIHLECNRFDFEIEITAKIANSGRKIHFIDISYSPRSYEEGKKINVSDGIIALWKIIRYKIYPDEELLEPIFRHLRIRRIAGHIKGSRNILDVGCGPDFKFLRFVSPFASKCVGIDQYASEVSYSNIKTVKSRLDRKLPFDGQSFDTVTMLAVLEHLDNPKEVVEECFRVLKRGGKIIITVPSPASKPVLEFLSYRVGIVSKDEIRDHKNYFTKVYLTDIIKSAGFKDIQLKSYNLGMNYMAIGRK